MFPEIVSLYPYVDPLPECNVTYSETTRFVIIQFECCGRRPQNDVGKKKVWLMKIQKKLLLNNSKTPFCFQTHEVMSVNQLVKMWHSGLRPPEIFIKICTDVAIKTINKRKSWGKFFPA